jgi:hypothetical protein
MAQVERKRVTYWAISLLLIGGIASVFLPAEKLGHFIDLMKSIIQNLLLGL